MKMYTLLSVALNKGYWYNVKFNIKYWAYLFKNKPNSSNFGCYFMAYVFKGYVTFQEKI